MEKEEQSLHIIPPMIIGGIYELIKTDYNKQIEELKKNLKNYERNNGRK